MGVFHVFHVGCVCFPREFLRRTVASRFLILVSGASGHDLTSRIELSRINQECQSCCGNGIKSLATIEWGEEWCSRVQMGSSEE
jgi:hypothetical protein